MNWIWVLMPLLCAVLGYATNWLAIKMLFRPHRQKFLFGKRLPFTPGLLHKERFRISKKIGETLSKNILTHEALIKALTSPEITEKIEAATEEFLCGIEKDERTLGEVGALLFGVEKDEIAMHIKQMVETYFLADKTIGDILPQNAVEWLAKPIEPRILPAVEFLKRTLDNNPGIEETLAALVSKIASQQLGSFLGIFIRYNELYSKIKTSFFEYLEDEENHADIAEKVSGLVSKASSTPNSAFSKIQAKLVEVSTEILHNAENMCVNRLFGHISKNGESRAKIKMAMVKMAIIALEKGGGRAISSLDISKLIENQLNSFDVAETEEMLLGVVGKELRWIMALGGIIGFIVGFVPVIFSMMGA